MIKIRAIKEHDAIGVDLHIELEGLKVICAVELKAILNALEHESPEIFHAGLELFLAERGYGEDESED